MWLCQQKKKKKKEGVMGSITPSYGLWSTYYKPSTSENLPWIEGWSKGVEGL